jgi:hypothetical protein
MNSEFYTLDYFVDKFESIPEEMISLTSEEEPTDVWEWCDKEESDALFWIVHPWGILCDVNDGIEEFENYGSSPKVRVLRFLNYIKANRLKFYYY